jgi:hypothetical protein
MLLKLRNQSDKQKVIDYIVKLPDKPYDISVKLHKQTRTCPQNRLYWMWINAISKDTGNEPEDLHDYFGGRWLPEHRYVMNGMTHVKPISTTKLNTAEFTAYLDKMDYYSDKF